jgi:hypothetical protein
MLYLHTHIPSLSHIYIPSNTKHSLTHSLTDSGWVILVDAAIQASHSDDIPTISWYMYLPCAVSLFALMLIQSIPDEVLEADYQSLDGSSSSAGRGCWFASWLLLFAGGLGGSALIYFVTYANEDTPEQRWPGLSLLLNNAFSLVSCCILTWLRV